MYSLMMTANGHIDPRGTMAPPIIMRTAATPMPTPKSSLGPESILGDDLMYREGVPQYSEAGLGFSEAGMGHSESRRGSATSIEPIAFDQRSLVSCGKIDPETVYLSIHKSGCRHQHRCYSCDIDSHTQIIHLTRLLSRSPSEE